MPSLSIQVDPGEIAKVRLMLGALSTTGDKVIQQAVNRTLSGVRTDATNEMAKVITPTKTKIRSTITTKNMTAKDGNAFVKCQGGPLNLIEFSARQTKKGVTVQVKKTEPRSLLKHAYIATMKSGKKLVMWRKYEGARKPVKPTAAYAKMQRKYRFPVEGLWSLAIPEVMGHKPTMDRVLDLGGDRLKKNLNDRLNYELGKLK